MLTYRICRYCRYATVHLQYFKKHLGTRKHKLNIMAHDIEELINPVPLTEVQKDRIVKENNERRGDRLANEIIEILNKNKIP